MHPIYNLISPDKLHFVDDYSQAEKANTFSNVLFRTDIAGQYNWHTNLAVEQSTSKIINTSNKLFSFFSFVHKHPLFEDYYYGVLNTYKDIISAPQEDIIVIDEPVFQFFDYESVNGTGHSFDVIFHLLYRFIKEGLSCKLLVPKTDNIYFQKTLDLLRTEFHVEFLEIAPRATYLFKTFTCTRQYQNVYFSEVKEFINKNLIQPIIERFEKKNVPSYSIVSKIKFGINYSLVRPAASFIKTPIYEQFSKEKNILDLDETFSEQEKIYYLNKASTVIVTWGSPFYINIHYYISDITNKRLSVIFHKYVMPEMIFLLKQGSNRFLHSLVGNYGEVENNIYSGFSFSGELIEDIDTIDDFVKQTSI